MAKWNFDIKVSGNTLVVLALVIGAGIIAALGHDGWGWFLGWAFAIWVLS